MLFRSLEVDDIEHVGLAGVVRSQAEEPVDRDVGMAGDRYECFDAWQASVGRRQQLRKRGAVDFELAREGYA